MWWKSSESEWKYWTNIWEDISFAWNGPIVTHLNAKYCHSGHSAQLISIFLLQYTFFVVTKDNEGELVDKPLHIHVTVEDINDNPPVCQQAVTVLEVQENEGGGKKTDSTHLYTSFWSCYCFQLGTNKTRISDPKVQNVALLEKCFPVQIALLFSLQ